MPPPTISVSARSARLARTRILSDTFAPPRIAVNGRRGVRSARPSISSSLAIRKPAAAGRKPVTPCVEAWALWAAPKASLTYTSASDAREDANSGELALLSGGGI